MKPLYLFVPHHLYVIFIFLHTISNPKILFPNLIAYILMMGTVLGVNGINGSHELGHKTREPFNFFMTFSLTTSI